MARISSGQIGRNSREMAWCGSVAQQRPDDLDEAWVCGWMKVARLPLTCSNAAAWTSPPEEEAVRGFLPRMLQHGGSGVMDLRERRRRTVVWS
ncbi:hypothetical protein PR202_ga26301 [Eleusine coracana subsp. coracana]|uniref:Uncharacterized protein n=1 Tax=Eleusine coracana subsp. coracana TaxID=191504 RepID=A0AAV5DD38_ELECO|nr:hypothetical protein PR202_ga26301 [Eleusine coracana subsp. coracana]